MRRFSILGFLICLLSLFAPVVSPVLEASAQVASYPLNSQKLLSPSDLGATGNGIADDTLYVQAAIDKAYKEQTFIVWIDKPYRITHGLVLKKGVSLLGNTPASFKGSPPLGNVTRSITAKPSGGTFLVDNCVVNGGYVAVTVEGKNYVFGVGFYYPQQDYVNVSGLKQFPPTIQKRVGQIVESLHFENLNFTGASACFDLRGQNFVNDYLVDVNVLHCYGYPMAPVPGPFLDLKLCLDLPRIEGNHVNPGSGGAFLGPRTTDGNFTVCSYAIIDYITQNALPSFRCVQTDDFMYKFNFVFGVKIGYQFLNSYGTIIACNADMVWIGLDIAGFQEARRAVTVLGMNGFPSAGPSAGRALVRINFDVAGLVDMTGLFASTGTNAVVASSNAPSAQALVLVTGSAPGFVVGRGLSRTSLGGSWTGTFGADNVVDKSANPNALIDVMQSRAR